MEPANYDTVTEEVENVNQYEADTPNDPRDYPKGQMEAEWENGSNYVEAVEEPIKPNNQPMPTWSLTRVRQPPSIYTLYCSLERSMRQ